MLNYPLDFKYLSVMKSGLIINAWVVNGDMINFN